MLKTADVNSLYKDAALSAGSGIVIIDSDRKIVFLNRYAELLMCQSSNDLLGLPFEEHFVLVNFISSVREDIPFDEMSVTKESYLIDHRVVLLTSSKGECFIDGSIAPVIMPEFDENTIHWIFTFRDMTHIIKYQDDLQKYSKAVDQLMSTVIITDREFNIEYVNPRFYYMTGIQSDTVMGQFLADIPLFKEFHEGTFERMTSTIHKDGRWYGEIKGVNKFGREYWLFVNATSIVNESKIVTHYVFIIDDVTDRKLYEIELRNERRRLEAIVKHAPVGMIFLNQDTRIVSINEVGAAMFGHTSIDIIGHMICDILTCDNKTKKNDRYCKSCYIGYNVHRALEYGELIQGEEFLQYIRLDDELIPKWFKTSISPMIVEKNKYALVIVEDITKNKETASELETNEKRLRLITDTMLDLITQVTVSGQIIYASPSHFSILGYKTEFLIQKNLFDFVHPDDLQNILSKFNNRISTWNNFTTELRIRKENGEYLWMESVGNVVSDDNGTMSIVYVSRDITIKKQAEYEIIRSRERAIEASKAKSQFLANMSHEIRTPLNGIIGMTNLTLMSEISIEQRENLNMVKNSAITLLNIINDVLDFSKIEAGKVAIEKIRFNLYDLVHKVVKPLKVNALQKNIDLIVDIDKNIPEFVLSDPVRLNQILNNLISNGIKFTETGYVKLKLVGVSIGEEASDIQFIVEDTGIGIADDDLERIFNSFSQADGTITRKYGGTGLGLSISKMLVELMGGSLEVSSQMGRGSSFFFTFSLKSALESPKGVAGEEDYIFDNSDAAPLKILVCEDEKINQRFIMRLLGKQGHEVDLAENGLEGIKMLQSKNYDVVLMDIQMPIMDGLSAVSVIRNELKMTIPVIAVTAYALKGDKDRFIKAGMDDYISKPIHIKEFYDILNAVTKRGSKAIEDNLLQKVLNKQSDEVIVNVDQYTTLLKELKLFLEKNEAEMIERLSHKLKNQFEEDNLLQLKRMALKLELAARRSAFNDANELYIQLVDQLEALKGGQ